MASGCEGPGSRKIGQRAVAAHPIQTGSSVIPATHGAAQAQSVETLTIAQYPPKPSTVPSSGISEFGWPFTVTLREATCLCNRFAPAGLQQEFTSESVHLGFGNAAIGPRRHGQLYARISLTGREGLRPPAKQ